VDIETYMREARRFDNHKPDTMLDALTHGLMAEVGEVAELIAYGEYGIELVYELGDVAWNLARLADVLDMEPDDLYLSDRASAPVAGRDLAVLVSRASKVAGVLEKNHRTTTPAEWKLKNRLRREVAGAWWAWKVLVERCDRRPADVMAVNIDKLTRRYAERGLTVKEAS
jgi:NTP pyrophosphatase (non-canonical NTP hydrolase)